MITRFALIFTIGHKKFESYFLPFFSPLALIGLLYTIIIIFAQQAQHILHNLGPVFRTFVPMIMYFLIMFGMTFAGMWWWSRNYSTFRLVGGVGKSRGVGYEEAAVQSFTAASNNFVSHHPFPPAFNTSRTQAEQCDRNYQSQYAWLSLVSTRIKLWQLPSVPWWKFRFC